MLIQRWGWWPRKLCINGKELALLSDPTFLCQKASYKTSKFKVRVYMVKTNSKPTTLVNGKIDGYGHRHDVDPIRIHISFGHASFHSICNILQCCGEVNKRIFKWEFSLRSSTKINFPNILEFCVDCAMGKIGRSPMHFTLDPSTRILDWVHIDCVAIKTSRYKERHGTYVTDGRSRYAEIKFYRTKAHHFDEVKNIISRWERAQHPFDCKHCPSWRRQIKFTVWCILQY